MIDYGCGFGAFSQVSLSYPPSAFHFHLQDTKNITGFSYCLPGGIVAWGFSVLALCVIVVPISDVCVMCSIGFISTCE